MKPKVYIETTVVSYLTARPSRDPIVSGLIASSKLWWKTTSHMYDLCTSELVFEEASAGDSTAASDRLKVLNRLLNLTISNEAERIAEALLAAMALPAKAKNDALHLGIAASNGIDYLLTWNCRHLANATLRGKIQDTCSAVGYEPPIICTPAELMEDQK